MGDIGAEYGIRVHFNNQGQMVGLIVGCHQPVGQSQDRAEGFIALHEDFPPAVREPGVSLPHLVLDDALEAAEVRHHRVDPGSGRRAYQGLNGGIRTITIFQGEPPRGPHLGPAEPASAWIHMDITLTSRTPWHLTLTGGHFVLDPVASTATADLPHGGFLRLSSARPMTLESDAVLRLDLPEGVSWLDLWVEHRPSLPITDSVIMALPSQLREAAVMASVIGAGQKERPYIPIITPPLPPMTTAEFRTANARLGELAQQVAHLERELAESATLSARTNGIILPSGQSLRRDAQDILRQRDEVSRQMGVVQDQVLDYATWSRQWERAAHLLTVLTETGQRTLIVLYPYPHDMLAALPPATRVVFFLWEGLKDATAEWAKSVVSLWAGRTSQPDIIWYKDLENLGLTAWPRLRPDPFPGHFAIPDDPRFYPLGIVDALKRGRVLLPRGRASDKISIEDIHSALNSDPSDRLVVVEADGSTHSLIGALYAYHTASHLAVNSMPSLDDILGIIRTINTNIQREQLATAAAGAYRYIGEHRKTFLASPQTDPGLKQIVQGLNILELPTTMPTPYSEQAFVQSVLTYLSAQDAGVTQGYRYEETQWSQDLQSLTAAVTARVDGHVRKMALRKKSITVFGHGLPYTLVEGWEGKAIGHIIGDSDHIVLREVARARLPRPPVAFAATLDPGLIQSPPPDLGHGPMPSLTLTASEASLTSLALYASQVPLEMLYLHTQGTSRGFFLRDAAGRAFEARREELELNVDLPWGPLVVHAAPFSWLGAGVSCLRAGARGFVGTLWGVPVAVMGDVARQIAARMTSGSTTPSVAVANLDVLLPLHRQAFLYLGVADSEAPDRLASVDATISMLYPAVAELSSAGLIRQADQLFDRLRTLVSPSSDPLLQAVLAVAEADMLARRAGRSQTVKIADLADAVGVLLREIESLPLDEELRTYFTALVREPLAALLLSAGEYEDARAHALAMAAVWDKAGALRASAGARYRVASVDQGAHQWPEALQTLLAIRKDLERSGEPALLAVVAMSLAATCVSLSMYPDATRYLAESIGFGINLGSPLFQELVLTSLAVLRAVGERTAYSQLAEMARTLAMAVEASGAVLQADGSPLAEVYRVFEDAGTALATEPFDEIRWAAVLNRASVVDGRTDMGLEAMVRAIRGEKAPPPTETGVSEA